MISHPPTDRSPVDTIDFVKVTENTVLVPITIQMKNRDVTFVTKDGVAKGVVNILVGFAPLYPAEFVVIQIQQIVGQN